MLLVKRFLLQSYSSLWVDCMSRVVRYFLETWVHFPVKSMLYNGCIPRSAHKTSYNLHIGEVIVSFNLAFLSETVQTVSRIWILTQAMGRNPGSISVTGRSSLDGSWKLTLFGPRADCLQTDCKLEKCFIHSKYVPVQYCNVLFHSLYLYNTV